MENVYVHLVRLSFIAILDKIFQDTMYLSYFNMNMRRSSL